MKLAAAMTALQQAGTAQNRKVYARYGAREPVFGVSYKNLYALQKQIGQDHALAQQLWHTSNHDARVLATLVADPQQMTGSVLERWLDEATNRFLSMAFAILAVRCPAAAACARRWIDGEGEYRIAAGWAVLAGRVEDPAVTDAELTGLLQRIERTVHGSPNFARYMMNNCLIAISARPALYRGALAVAKRIGAVEVDHGDTDCKTPLASEYIEKMAARRAAKASGAGKAARKDAGPARGGTRPAAPRRSAGSKAPARRAKAAGRGR
jgi:3-methyladenine DNA glycosylase AlkD